MNFEAFVNQAWNEHADKAIDVADRLETAVSMMEKDEHVVQLVSLATHVLGEHLGQWSRGTEFLSSLKEHPLVASGSESEKSILRSIASLEVAADESRSLNDFSRSDQIRILAVAASALVGQSQTVLAAKLFRDALDLAGSGLESGDPSYRALAVTGNNLACGLEEKNQRTGDENELMLLSARVGRKFWEIAGTWSQVAMAEYRLAMSYLKAGEHQRALSHAQTCIDLYIANEAPPSDLFWGYEALAVVERERKNQIGFQTAFGHTHACFEKLNEEDKARCEPSLNKLVD